MNCDRKRMKLEITRLIEAQQCEIIAKLSKPNAPSKRVAFDDANNEEYCVVMMRTLMKFWKRCELKKNHLSMTKSNLSRHLVNLKVLPTSKALKLYITVLNIKDQLLCSDVQTEEDICMMNCNDHLRHSSKTFTN